MIVEDFEKLRKKHDDFDPFTPPKFNIAPERRWLEHYFPIGKVYNFSVAMLNFGGVTCSVLK